MSNNYNNDHDGHRARLLGELEALFPGVVAEAFGVPNADEQKGPGQLRSEIRWGLLSVGCPPEVTDDLVPWQASDYCGDNAVADAVREELNDAMNLLAHPTMWLETSDPIGYRNDLDNMVAQCCARWLDIVNPT